MLVMLTLGISIQRLAKNLSLVLHSEGERGEISTCYIHIIQHVKEAIDIVVSDCGFTSVRSISQDQSSLD